MAAILDAIRMHRIYATSGSRIFLDARANGKFMGEDVEATEKVELILHLDAPGPIERAVLFRDGEVVHTEPGKGRKSLAAVFVDRPGAGFHWYYWRAELAGVLPAYRGKVQAPKKRRQNVKKTGLMQVLKRRRIADGFSHSPVRDAALPRSA